MPHPEVPVIHLLLFLLSCPIWRFFFFCICRGDSGLLEYDTMWFSTFQRSLMPASSRIKIQILLKIKTTSLSTMLPIVYKSIWDQVLNLKLRILTCPSEWTNSFKNYYYYDNFIFNSFHFENRNSCSKILNMHQFRALGVHNTNIFNQINSIYL